MRSLAAIWLGALVSLASAPFAHPTLAQERGALFPRYSLEGWAGYEYDSNVAVSDIDTTANSGDSAAVFDLGAEVTVYEGPLADGEIGYDFYQSLYSDLTDYDLRLHLPWVSVSRDALGIDWAADYRYARIILGEDFLYQTHTLTPNLGRLFGERLYAQAAYEYQKRDYADFHPLSGVTAGRSGDRHGLRLDAIWIAFRGYLRVSYRLTGQDTLDDDFDFLGNLIDASFRIPLPELPWEREGVERTSVGGSYSYDHRNYDLGREDRVHDARARLELPIVGPIRVRVEYQHVDSDSTLPSVTYVANIITLSMGVSY